MSIVSMFLAQAGMLPTAQASSSLQNSNFESGFDYWTLENNLGCAYSIETLTPIQGTKSARIEDDSATATCSIWQEVDVDAGQVYQVAATARVLAGEIEMRLEYRSGSGAILEEWSTESEVSTGTTLSLIGQAPSASALARIVFETPRGIGNAFVDNVLFQTRNSIPNSGFESGQPPLGYPWVDDLECTSSSAAWSNGGIKSLHLVGSPEDSCGLSRLVEADETNISWEFSAHVNVINGSAEMRAVWHLDSHLYQVFATTPGVHKLRLVLPARAASHIGLFIISRGEIYVDDVVARPVNHELLSNQGFETGDISGWTLSPSPLCWGIVSSSYAWIGSYGLGLQRIGSSAPTCYAQQELPAHGGHDYLLSGYLGCGGSLNLEFYNFWGNLISQAGTNSACTGPILVTASAPSNAASVRAVFKLNQPDSFYPLDDVHLLDEQLV